MARPANAAVEYAKSLADAAYFTDTYCRIDDAQGDGGHIPFRLWPMQCDLMWRLMVNDRTVILKARQLGISWLCCAYALWTVLFKPGQVVMVFSKGQAEANEMLRRVGVLYDRLPDWLKGACAIRICDNTEVHEFSNGSRVRSMPATKSAGRSYTASLAILDEFAFMQWADTLLGGAKPTIDAGGRMVVLSTANGIGNTFHRLWVMAQSPENGYDGVFLPYWARPARTQEWYAKTMRESIDPDLMKQEYPATATEAFLSSGRARFKSDWIEAQSKNRADVLDPGPLAHIPGVEVYAHPVQGKKYIIGADVAEGIKDGDYDDAVIMEYETWTEVASIRGQWEPGVFAEYVHRISEYYNRAQIMVERNNHGHAMITKLLELEGDRVPDGTMVIGIGDDNRRGWLTTAKSKPMAIDFLAEALRDGLVTFNSATAIQEMSIYETKENGSTGAPDGYHDDGVMSRAIAVMVLRRPVIPFIFA